MMKKALYIVEDKETPQFRYRVKNLKEALEDSTNWGVEYVLKTDINDLKLDNYSLMVVERQTAKDGLIIRLIESAKQIGIKVLFDIDDLVFDCGTSTTVI